MYANRAAVHPKKQNGFSNWAAFALVRFQYGFLGKQGPIAAVISRFWQFRGRTNCVNLAASCVQDLGCENARSRNQTERQGRRR